MPLFGSKFSPKKTIARRSSSSSNLQSNYRLNQSQISGPSSLPQPHELGLDFGPIRLKLGDNEATFKDGKWTSDFTSKGGSSKEVMDLKRENKSLKEQNNLLQLKIEILLDMLAETTAEAHIQEAELHRLESTTAIQKRK